MGKGVRCLTAPPSSQKFITSFALGHQAWIADYGHTNEPLSIYKNQCRIGNGSRLFLYGAKHQTEILVAQ